MNDFTSNFILKLPVELQFKILNHIPQFTRLNKRVVAGKFHLNKLDPIPIHLNELRSFVNNNNPNRYLNYYINNNIYIVFENYSSFGHYNTIYHYIYYNNDENNIKIEVSDKWNNCINFMDEIKMMSYDIVTAYNIYKINRKECNNMKDYILNYFDDNLEKYKNDNPFFNKIIQTIYTYSNLININDPKRLSLLTTRLSTMLNFGYHDMVLSYLKNFDNNKSEIYEYITYLEIN